MYVSLIEWQTLVEEAQMLAAMCINPDKLASLPLDDLLGTAAFLKRKYAEREA